MSAHRLPVGSNPPAGVGAQSLARQVSKDDDRELEALRLVHGHQADAVAVFLEDRRFRRLRCLCREPQLVDESAERNTAAHLVLARDFGDVEHVGERLLAAGPQRKTHVCARRGQELLQCSGDAA